ncbi:MAG: nucleotidyltransferase domain-containing protein [bacterium]|jgi:predicted nucleotidyltransferase
MRDNEIFRESLNLILEIFKKNLNPQAKVYLFGSSVKGDYKKFSDIDIAIENIDKKALTNIRYQIENLNIPYKVEIIDLSKVSKKFKKEILQTGVLIWKN